jgi:DNA-directed RNA polymerase specialized sigma24 family protein
MGDGENSTGPIRRSALRPSEHGGPDAPRTSGADEEWLQANEVLDTLAEQVPVKAKIVKLCFFAGLENGEIAALLDVTGGLPRSCFFS